jgi:hypothetical protein
VVAVAAALVASLAAVAIEAVRTGNDEEQRHIEVVRTDLSAAVTRHSLESLATYCKKVDCTARVTVIDSDRVLRLLESREKQEPPYSLGDTTARVVRRARPVRAAADRGSSVTARRPR